MKTKNNNSKHFHEHFEQLLRHKLSIIVVTSLMFTGVIFFDSRMRGLMQHVYSRGWGWIGTHLHHEHPQHAHMLLSRARLATNSGPGPS